MAGEPKGLAIGIDIGTTNSCVGVWQHDHVEIIANDQGNRTTPSTVAFTDSERLIGDAAKNQVAMNPRNTVYDTKRLISRRYSDASVQSDMKWWPFKVTPDPGDKPMIVVNYKGEDRQFAAEEISSMVLFRLKETAEAFLGSTVENAVITVPANFSNSQRQATKDVGFISGLKFIYIINEPTAAVLAYDLDKKTPVEKNVLIFDLGGGTLDVSLLTIEEGIIKLKSNTGDAHLGGEDFDNRMVNHFMKEFKRRNDKDISGYARALRRLRAHCEKAKKSLSSISQTTIEIDSLYEGVDFYSTITRSRFEELNIDLFQKCIYQVEKCLSNAKMEKSDVHEVVLVGGSTYIPKVQQLLKDFFNGNDLRKSINPDELVAYGAAVQAAFLRSEGNLKFQDKLLENFCNRIMEEHEKLEAKSALENYIYHMRNTMKKIEDAIGEATSWLDANQLAEADAFENKMKELESVCNPTAAKMYQNNVVGSSMEKEHEKNVEAKNAFENYLNNMRNMMKDENIGENLVARDKKNIVYVIDEAMSWLDANQHAKASGFKYKLKELESVCNPIIVKMYQSGAFAAGWLIDEKHKRNMEAKNALEQYVYNMGNTVKDENIMEKLDVIDKKKIEDEIDEAMSWLNANYLVEADEFEYKLTRLENLCNPIIANLFQCRDDAGCSMDERLKNLEEKHALISYTYNMRNALKEGKIEEKLGVTDKKKIEDAIDETILWLDANQLAEADEFEDKLKEVESICNPIIVNMYEGGAFAGGSMEDEHNKNLDAKNALENYVYNMRNTMKDEDVGVKFGVTDKEKIEDAIDEAISWLDTNQLAEADEFDDKLKELESICNPIIVNMYEGGAFANGSMENKHNNNMEAKNALESYM